MPLKVDFQGHLLYIDAMTTLADTTPTSIRYFQDETAKLHENTKMFLSKDERDWLYHSVAQLIKSAKARGSNPNNPLFTDERTITGLHVRERFIASNYPEKGIYRKRLLNLTTLMSDPDMERLWTILEMVNVKRRAALTKDIISLVEQAYAWGETCEPHDNFDRIISEISTW